MGAHVTGCTCGCENVARGGRCLKGDWPPLATGIEILQVRCLMGAYWILHRARLIPNASFRSEGTLKASGHGAAESYVHFSSVAHLSLLQDHSLFLSLQD